jgi:hypothetical protein
MCGLGLCGSFRIGPCEPNEYVLKVRKIYLVIRWVLVSQRLCWLECVRKTESQYVDLFAFGVDVCFQNTYLCDALTFHSDDFSLQHN